MKFLKSVEYNKIGKVGKKKKDKIKERKGRWDDYSQKNFHAVSGLEPEILHMANTLPP